MGLFASALASGMGTDYLNGLVKDKREVYR